MDSASARKSGKVDRQQSSGSASGSAHAGPSSAHMGPSSAHSGPNSAHSQALFLQKVKESTEAVNCGDFRRAVVCYTDAITLDPCNHILYTNRSAAHAKLQQYQRSLLDARKARELNPKWAKAYIREGSALQQLGQHADALAAFASGLAHDANNASLLSGLTDSALKCPLKEKLEPVFQQLQKLKLDKSPFVIISVIGQELLQAGHYKASVQMLESALKIGTCSLKLRGSVFSALSSAYWGLGHIDKAIVYMTKDLQVAKSLGDQEGECRAYGNLGSAYFSKGQYKEALTQDRFQLVLAMRMKDRPTATVALSSLGHVYTAIGDYPNALKSHKQCVLLLKQCNDKLAEAREIGNVGAVYLAMGNFETAVECHQEHLKIAKSLKNNVEEARAYSNLGSAFHYKRNYEKAIGFHKHVLKIGEQRSDKLLEARAYAGLGHAARCMHDYGSAKTYHEKQLDNALQTKDKVAEGRACSNLGIIYHQLAEFDAALKLHQVHIEIAKDLGDRASQGRAYGNIGNAHSSLGQYEQAIKFHKLELAISVEVNDRHSEGATHGNLAVAYQASKMYESAHQHYVAHLNISRELKDNMSESRALCNLGHYHSMRGEYTNSIPYYEQYLMLTQELHDSEGEAKACFSLGYAHFALGNYIESVRYYEQDLSLARELKDQLGIARAYCNLGLAQKALLNFKEALECQRKCLNMMTTLKNVKGRFRSLGNIGDILLKTGEVTEAVKMYNQQLQLAKQCNSMDLLATANGALGSAHRTLGQNDKALGFHTQELSIRQDMKDPKGECRAHGNLGNVYMALAKYMNAFKCYEEQLEKSRELQDSALEANACGNLAITKMNMGNFEEAIGLFEQQLAMLQQVHGNTATFDRGRAFGSLGDCYEALGDYEESIKCHEQYLAIAQNATSLSDQDKAYRGLGNAHRSVGNLQQALVCFEKRLVVAHELNSSAAKASAYGELGCLHSLLGNFEQAISCLQHQLTIAREMGDRLCEGDAACGLGGVYQQMGEYDKALEYHQMDLGIAESSKNTACQCRAYGNLGLSHESLGEYEKAIKHQEQHLSIAAQMNDRVAKTLAYSSLGRVHHALGNHPQAVEYLRQGLQIAEQLGRMEDEAKIRHRLGLALWGKGDFEECQSQLYKASELFESIRRDAQFNSEYKLSLFDLQTACYQALQRVLVTLDRHKEALVVAERACTRAFIDLLMERQAGSEGFYGNHVTDPPPITTDQIISIIGKQRSVVLCFSVAAGYLYSWLLTPKDGIVKFHETSMVDLENETDLGDNVSMKSTVSFSTCSLLDSFVGQIRETMGVENHAPSGQRLPLRSLSAETDSDVEDLWEQHLEELGDKLNADNDRTGFLRIVNRNHLFNSSNYSLSSLFSVSASLGSSYPGAGFGRKNSVRSNKLANKSAISALYQLLIEPFEEIFKELSDDPSQGLLDLTVVLQGDLYLLPFSVLRKDQTMEYLFERFNLIVVPSITSIQNVHKQDKRERPVIDSSGAVVVGNPKLTPAICQHWHLGDIPTSEYEARIVGEILTARPLIGQEATKGAVLNQIEQVEVIHFAAHVSWKLSSIVLSPGELPAHPTRFPTIDSDDSSSDISSFDGPSLSEYLLTAADILHLKLHAKLVVLSAGYTADRAGRINSDGVVGLTRSLLSAGARSVLYCLWPVPDQASKLLMRTLYIGLQEGKRVSEALAGAIKTVQTTKQFSHPSNWGGWVLMGHDIRLSSKVAQMGHAICELLQHPAAQCREAMRVLLHLIEKSLQRIHQGVKNSMYTTAQSIENKVGGLAGWKDLLQAVGFRFEPSTNGLPPAVFFPQSDPGGRLTQASASLQAVLGLPQGSIGALSKFLHNYEAGEAIIRVMRDILSKMAAKEQSVDVQVNVKLWRAPGCHEFLASLSLDLVDVGNEEVTLRLGKQANKRHLQFALQSLVAVFDTQEAPRLLALDSSSSLESLSSSHSGSTSTSNFSKGSTPPLSPRGRKKSLFNPAEMEKMRAATNRINRMSQGGLVGRKVMDGKSSKAGINDPSLCLAYQNQIKSRYPPYSPTSSGNGDDGLEVSVVALSDSDTPKSLTDSPDLGSSSASERLQRLVDMETKEWTVEVTSGRSTPSEEEQGRRSRNSDTTLLDIDRDITFIRNEQDRNSSISYGSGDGQDQESFERNSNKRSSDLSEMSLDSGGRLTPRNQRDLEMFLEHTDDQTVHQLSGESGIVSEATSNQSDGSQQSDQTNFAFDPQEIAKKIMLEVTDHKSALDGIQRASIIQSQMKSMHIRNQYQNVSASISGPKPPMSSQTEVDPSVKEPSVSVSRPVEADKVTSKLSPSSAFMSPSHSTRVPPPVANKPVFHSSSSGFQAPHSASVNTSSNPASGPHVNAQFSNQSKNDQELRGNKVGETTAITLKKSDSFSCAPVASSNASTTFTSFRPAGQTLAPAVDRTTAISYSSSSSHSSPSQYRPDSSTSTSSYCSTPSSVMSVIHQPWKAASQSPLVTAYDSSSEQTSGSGSASTVTPTSTLEHQDSPFPKRDPSPALSTGSSASSKSGKPKKKVSFSDSEPCESPSGSLNGSASNISFSDSGRGSGSGFGPQGLSAPNGQHLQASSKLMKTQMDLSKIASPSSPTDGHSSALPGRQPNSSSQLRGVQQPRSWQALHEAYLNKTNTQNNANSSVQNSNVQFSQRENIQQNAQVPARPDVPQSLQFSQSDTFSNNGPISPARERVLPPYPVSPRDRAPKGLPSPSRQPLPSHPPPPYSGNNHSTVTSDQVSQFASHGNINNSERRGMGNSEPGQRRQPPYQMEMMEFPRQPDPRGQWGGYNPNFSNQERTPPAPPVRSDSRDSASGSLSSSQGSTGMTRMTNQGPGGQYRNQGPAIQPRRPMNNSGMSQGQYDQRGQQYGQPPLPQPPQLHVPPMSPQRGPPQSSSTTFKGGNGSIPNGPSYPRTSETRPSGGMKNGGFTVLEPYNPNKGDDHGFRRQPLNNSGSQYPGYNTSQLPGGGHYGNQTRVPNGNLHHGAVVNNNTGSGQYQPKIPNAATAGYQFQNGTLPSSPSAGGSRAPMNNQFPSAGQQLHGNFYGQDRRVNGRTNVIQSSKC